MKKYVAFLRAINVTARKGVKMEDLKRPFEALGLKNVQTFIQSGNVIFETEREMNAAFVSQLESRLEALLGYKSDVFLRSMDEVKAIADQRFYRPGENEVAHVVFLNQAPDKKAAQALAAFNGPADEFTVKGREVYNLRRDRDASVFSNQFIEKTLKVTATTRNLNTVRKIAEKFQ
ncbi:MAG: DUF1697 domain-containing protein [Chloroflexota bacterium]